MEQLAKETFCCCGCGLNSSQSNHWCTSGDRVMSWCFSEGAPEGFGGRWPCKRCCVAEVVPAQAAEDKIIVSPPPQEEAPLTSTETKPEQSEPPFCLL